MAKKDTMVAYLQGVLKSVPEEKKAGVQAKIDALMKDDEILELLGDGVMMKADYSRNFDALRASKEALDKWYAETLETNSSNAQAAEELAGLRAAGRIKEEKPTDDDLDDETPSFKKLRESMVTKDEGTKIVQSAVGEGMRGTTSLLNAVIRLSGQHQMRFNEVLDPDKLLDYARKNKASTIEQAYEAMYADKIEKFNEDREKSARQKLKDQLRTEVLAELKSAGPYPITTEESQESSGSALSGMKGAEDQYSVNAAADDYARRVAARGTSA